MDQHIKKVYVPMTETAFYILLCLRKPNHGYGIVQTVEKMTDGAIRLAPGTMYGSLSKMEKDKVEKIEEELKIKIQDTEVNNVYLLTSGPVPFNPSELLGTADIDFLLELLKKEFDLIIIDTPPASIITDALIYAKKVDYMFLVASSRKTKKELLLNTKKAIEAVGGKIPGIILNQIATDRRKEYSKSYQKYVLEK